MIYKQTYNNYWTINVEELPTRGLLYRKDIHISVRPMNLQEIKYLSTLNDETATDIVREIFKKCVILENLIYDELFLCDREWLIFWLRVNSFSRNNGYTINCKCHECGENIEKTINLTDFEIDYLDNDIECIELPESGDTIQLKLPIVNDLRIKYEDDEIEKLARHICVNNPIEYVISLSALDYMYLKNYVDSIKCGFNKNIKIFCNRCSSHENVSILIDDKGIFGSTNLFEIIELLVRITKYTNFQITEDTPWCEIEVIKEVVNKISKEESEEIKKQNNKMKSGMKSR